MTALLTTLIAQLSCTYCIKATMATRNTAPVVSTSGEGLGDGSSTISEKGGLLFLPGNDSLCVHTHSAAARRGREYGGWASPSSLGGL